MTDEDKHADCFKRTGHPAVFIPPSLYDAAERGGHDMRDYVKVKPVPVEYGSFAYQMDYSTTEARIAAHQVGDIVMNQFGDPVIIAFGVSPTGRKL